MLELIEKAFNKALEREPENKPSEVYVTELVGCVRRSWYKRRYGYRASREMIIGTAIHLDVLSKVVEQLSSMFDIVEAEKKIEKLVSVDGNDVWLVGRVDLYIADRQKNVKTFVEFKTSEWIFEEHIEQANIYAYMLNTDKFYICYMPKSDQIKCKEFERTWTEQEVIQRIKQLLSDSEPPKRENYWCNYCEFKNLCKKNKTLV
ncbi:MAG: CRISPR-associated protein Cas4 [Ignisphaera sp.]|nr:CRISPR-associated protein Cas4 [Ignisphaera sp.]